MCFICSSTLCEQSLSMFEWDIAQGSLSVEIVCIEVAVNVLNA